MMTDRQYSNIESVTALVAKAEALAQTNRNRGAAGIYRKLCQIEPKNPRWPHKLGDTNRRLNRGALAVKAYERSISLYMGTDQPRHAMALCKAARSLAPDNMAVRALELRLQATILERSREQDRHFAEKVSSCRTTPKTGQDHPSVADFVEDPTHSIDIARVQAQAIKEAAAGNPPATWDPPEQTPMVEISEDIHGVTVEYEPIRMEGTVSIRPRGEVNLDPEAEMKTQREREIEWEMEMEEALDREAMPVAEDIGTPRQPEESLDDIPIIIDLPPDYS